jgi:hypothetical protein
MQVVLLDLRNSQLRILAVLARRVLADQELKGIDGALIIFCIEEIAHRAEQFGHLTKRGGDIRAVRGNQVHALILDDQGRVILKRARALRARFERLAGFFRALKLRFCGIAAGGRAFIGEASEREKRQSQHGREKHAQDWPDWSGVRPQRLPHSFVKTTRPSASTVR